MIYYARIGFIDLDLKYNKSFLINAENIKEAEDIAKRMCCTKSKEYLQHVIEFTEGFNEFINAKNGAIL
jgi:predicted ATP-binding protein involved in virulence